MPGLKVFGRRWGLSSDDFVFPEVSEGIIRFMWQASCLLRFIVMLCIYFLHSNPNDCQGGKHLQTYILVLLVYNSLLILLCFVTAYIPCLLYVRCPLILFECGWTVTGTYWVWSVEAGSCEAHVVTAVKFTVAIGWILLFIFVWGVWLTFDPLGHIHHTDLRMTSQKAKKIWKLRLQLVFLCASRDDNAKKAFEDVAQLLTDFFQDTDLVLSDLWAGLLLLLHSEFQVLLERRRPCLSPNPPPEWMNLGLANRMMDFSLAVYGWPYYVMNNCSPGDCYRLLRKLRCCRQCRCDQVLVLKDNCCQCHTSAFLLQTGIREMDLFHANFRNKIYEVPFVACADAATSSIVVTIRGSMSLRDAVTDMCMSDESLLLQDSGISLSNGTLHTTQPGPEPRESDTHSDIRVHRGILNSARYVLNSLTSEKVIEDMQVLYPDYDLVITGHSLGAGVAAVVGMLLRPKYPNIRCFCFSPPGCVVSEGVLAQTQDFIFSLVVGDDLVPRLSYDSMRIFKRSILAAIENSDQPKYEILLRGCYKLLCGPRNYHAHQRLDNENDVEAPPDPVIRPQSERDSSVVADDEPLLRSRIPSSNYTESGDGGRVRLHIPGRILHITPTPSQPEDLRCCSPCRDGAQIMSPRIC